MKVPWTRSGARQFGRMCRTAIREVAAPERPGRRDVVQLPEAQHRAPDEQRRPRHVDERQRQDHVPHARASRGHEGDGQDDRRERHEPVHEAHDDQVEAPVVARDEADQRAAERGDQHRDAADEERDPAPVDDQAVDVPAELVGAEEIRRRSGASGAAAGVQARAGCGSRAGRRRSRPGGRSGTRRRPRPRSGSAAAGGYQRIRGAVGSAARTVGARPRPSPTAAPVVVILVVADAGVDERVDHVDREVDQDVGRRRHQHDPLHHRVVAPEDRRDDEPADAREC